MAHRGVQYRELVQSATLSTAKTGLKVKNGWGKAGDVAASKMKAVIDARGEVSGKELMLSFEPMVAFKWVCDGNVEADGRKGVLLTCSPDAVST